MAKSVTKTKKTKKTETAKQTKKKIVNKNILKNKKFDENIFEARLHKYYDELKWLYCELYQDNKNALAFLEELVAQLKIFAESRADYLRALDEIRPVENNWYKDNKLIGMAMYPECFAGELKNFEKRIPYLLESNINYVQLLSVLESDDDCEADGAYVISDFRNVKKELGSIKDLSKLLEKCHENNINTCVDLVMNGTSAKHEWAIRSKHGEKAYRERYCMFDDEETANAFLQVANKDVYEITYLNDVEKYAITTHRGQQWELNYNNPVVFNKMIANLLFLANQGVDVIGLNGISYLWKQEYTNCCDLVQDYNIVRMLRIVCDIVCPSVALLANVETTSDSAVAYLGSAEKAQCQMLANANITAELWNTVATKDSALLKNKIDALAKLAKEHTLQNSIRTPKGISWNHLDYGFLSQMGADENMHKQYLNEFFEGKFEGSFSCGKLCNCSDEVSKLHLCGTTAALSGIEYYDEKKDKEGLARAIDCDLMLHGILFTLTGMPIIYSGDEIAQYNDYDNKKSAHKKNTAHYVYRAVFNWRKAGRRNIDKAIQSRVYQNLNKMEQLRSKYEVFNIDADVYTLDTWDKAVLAIVRVTAGEKFIGLYNFSDEEHTAWINEEDGLYTDLLTATKDIKANGVKLLPYQSMWLWRSKEEK